MPLVGLGTWQSAGETAASAVAMALHAGYRHIDTAPRYDNEEAVGEGLRRGGLARQDLFITTKVWYTEIGDGPLQRSAKASLRRLGLDHVDLLLIHWPNRDIPLAESMGALCDAKRRGLARHIGVANFPSAMLEEAAALSSEPIAANQCEYHPYLDQSSLLAACRRLGVQFVAYSPLGTGSLMTDPVIAEIARRHGKIAAQIILRWHVQQGVAAIPKSSNPQRIAANLHMGDFELTQQEMDSLFGLARIGGRMLSPTWAPRWSDHAPGKFAFPNARPPGRTADGC